MQKLILLTAILGNLQVTSYRAVKSQTDSTPFNTSTAERVHAGGVAVSRDLLCRACMKAHHRCRRPDNPTRVHYGDWLYIEGYGFRQINDVMGKYTTVRIRGRKVRLPIRRAVDIFVWTWKEEHAVGVQRRAVFKVDIRETDPEHYDVNSNGTVKGDAK